MDHITNNIQGGGDPEIRNTIINRIIKRHGSLIIAICAKHISGIGRQDAVQDVTSKFCKMSIEKLEEIENIGAKYINSMCRNHCVDIIRKGKSGPEIIGDIFAIETKGAIHDIEGENDKFIRIIEEIRIAISNAYDEEIAIIVTMMAMNFPKTEIAQRLGITINNLYVKKHRFIKDPKFIHIIHSILL